MYYQLEIDVSSSTLFIETSSPFATMSTGMNEGFRKVHTLVNDGVTKFMQKSGLTMRLLKK